MDISSTAASLTAVLAPALPYLIQSGSKISESLLQQIGADVWEKVKAIWQRLQPEIESKPSALEAAKDLAESSEDEDLRAALRVQLKKILSTDLKLAAELAHLLAETEPQAGHHVEVHGDGAAAVGNRAVAAGKGGVAIGGDVRGGVRVSSHGESEAKTNK